MDVLSKQAMPNQATLKRKHEQNTVEVEVEVEFAKLNSMLRNNPKVRKQAEAVFAAIQAGDDLTVNLALLEVKPP